MKILDGTAREILDSRGNPTVEVIIRTDTGIYKGRSPSGASTGRHEAVELRDGGERFGGKGVLRAVKKAKEVLSKVKGREFESPVEFDRFLIKLDGTDNKSRLGGNTTTALSMAVWYAFSQGRLYEYLLKDDKPVLPVPMMNIINGGKHAGNRLSIQEFLILPLGADKFSEALRIGCEVYHELGLLLEKRIGRTARNVGDEGGYAPNLSHTTEALDIILDSVEELGYTDRVKLGLDAASSSFYKGEEGYEIDGKLLTPGELLEYYRDLIKTYPIVSIEDPFHEEDFQGFADLVKKTSIQVVADDLTTTNIFRVKTALGYGSMTALLLKVNQVGTVTEALEAAKLCGERGLQVVVSHRSGETTDTFISDLSVGLSTGQIKTGAPARGERVVKYNRLLEIEEETDAPMGDLSNTPKVNVDLE